MPSLIRQAMPEDAARIRAIARAAYAKYVPRIGREPPPMVADFAGLTFTGAIKMALSPKRSSNPRSPKESLAFLAGERAASGIQAARDATQAYQLETKYACDRNAGSTDGPSGTPTVRAGSHRGQCLNAGPAQ